MTPQQIKENAPEGSTHYMIINSEVVYYQLLAKRWWRYFDGNDWKIGNQYTHKKPL